MLSKRCNMKWNRYKLGYIGCNMKWNIYNVGYLKVVTWNETYISYVI